MIVAAVMLFGVIVNSILCAQSVRDSDAGGAALFAVFATICAGGLLIVTFG